MIRRHLTYANVTSTIALCLALGAGSAYALDKIGSGNVKNNSLRSDDLKNRVAVKSKDVKRNALTGKEIRETELSVSALVGVAGASAVSCQPVDTPGSCVSSSIRLRRSSRIAVILSGEQWSPGAMGGSARCQVQIDALDQGFAIQPGEISTNTRGASTNGFARTLVTGSLAKGRHSVDLLCSQEGSSEVRIKDPALTLIAVGSK